MKSLAPQIHVKAKMRRLCQEPLETIDGEFRMEIQGRLHRAIWNVAHVRGVTFESLREFQENEQ